MGHSLRTDLIAMELAARLDMPMQVRRDLYYAALLKDAGCSSNAAAVFEMFGSDDIAAKRAWEAATNTYSSVPVRSAALYVFGGNLELQPEPFQQEFRRLVAAD